MHIPTSHMLNACARCYPTGDIYSTLVPSWRDITSPNQPSDTSHNIRSPVTSSHLKRVEKNRKFQTDFVIKIHAKRSRRFDLSASKI